MGCGGKGVGAGGATSSETHPLPSAKAEGLLTSLSPHAGPRGPCTHCDARTGRRIQEGLTLWTASHLGASFPSWACEPAGKPRGGAPWKLGREQGYRFAAFRNRSRGLHRRQPFPPKRREGPGRPRTLPRAQVLRTVCQQRGPACKGWSLGIRLPRDEVSEEPLTDAGALQFPPSSLPPSRRWPPPGEAGPGLWHEAREI